jgi:hypothetical protein
LGSEGGKSIYGVSVSRKINKKLESFKENNTNMLALGRNTGPDEPMED